MKASDNGINPKIKRYSPFIISNVFSCPNTKKYVLRIPIKAREIVFLGYSILMSYFLFGILSK